MVGTRHWSPEVDYYSRFTDLLLPYLLPHDTIVSGHSPGGGIDILAAVLATDLGFGLTEYPILQADIRARGFAHAAMLRNTRIVEDSHWMVALPCRHSRGTWDSVRKGRGRVRRGEWGSEPLVVVVECRR